MRLNLNALTSELNALALASYVLLGLGTLIFYLTVGMNPNFALLVHAVLFPLLALIYVFSKWLPGIIAAWPADTSPGAFGVGLLAYVLVLMGFFVVQFSLYMLERERAIRRVV
jgi:hypothetical protein